MSISFIAAGSTPTGATPSTIAYPAGIQQGDLLLAWVTWKPETTPMYAAPTGWLYLTDIYTGTGSGTNSGAARVMVFFKVASGNESGTTTANPLADTAASNGMLCYRNATGYWDLSVASNTGDDTYSIQMTTDPGVQAGDFAVGINGNPRGNGNYSGQSITQTGVTYGTVTERYEHINGNTPGMSSCAWDAEATAGTSSAAPTLGCTPPSPGTNTAVFVRIREASDPFAGHSGYVEATVPNPSADTFGFPYLISLDQMPSDWWNAVKSDGGDVRASDEFARELAVDRIHWTNNGDGTGSGMVAVMRFDSLATGTNKIRLWAGNSSLSLPAATDNYGQYNVYTGSMQGFIADGGGVDRTRYQRDFTSVAVGSPTIGGQAGPINGSKATEFDGSTQYCGPLTIPAINVPLTFIASVRPDTIAAYHTPMNLELSTDSNFQRCIRYEQSATNYVSAFARTSGGQRVSANTVKYSASVWSRGVGRHASNTNRSGGLNGVMGANDTLSVNVGALDYLSIGARSAGGVKLDGRLSLVQLFNLSNSDAWIAHDYAMLADPDQSDFYGTWTWVDGSSPATVPTPHYYRRQGALL